MRNMLCVLCIISALLCCPRPANAAQEDEAIHLMLDQYEKSIESKSLTLLGACLDGQGFLSIDDSPKGAIVLGKEAFLAATASTIKDIVSYKFTDRQIQLIGGVAWIRLCYSQQYKDRRYVNGVLYAVAANNNGKWQLVLMMPAFFQVKDFIVPDSGVVLVPIDQPHPAKDASREFVRGSLTFDWDRATGVFCPSGILMAKLTNDGSPAVILTTKEQIRAAIEEGMKAAREKSDLATAKTADTGAIAKGNLAVTTNAISAEPRDKPGTVGSMQSQVQLYVSQNGKWYLVTIIPFRLAADPATGTIISQERARDIKTTLTGTMLGIGVELGESPDGPLIRKVLPGSPALLAGLKDGETITGVEGKPTKGLLNAQVVSMIAGEEGTPVKLQVMGSDKASRSVTIYRGRIRITGVITTMLKDGVCLIEIDQFTRLTPEDVQKAVAEMPGKGAKGFILDIRQCAGGMPQAAKAIAEMFLPQGKRMWMEQHTGQRKRWVTCQNAKGYSMPMVVLVGPKTAGAGELVATALRNNPGITLLGQKTSGAARIRSMETGPDGAQRLVDQGIYLSLPEEPITDVGVKPNVYTDPNAPMEELAAQAAKLMFPPAN